MMPHDEWNEYDDYIEHMSATTPKTQFPSATSSLGAPFPFSNLPSKYNPDVETEMTGKIAQVKDSPTLPSQSTFPSSISQQFSTLNKKKLVLDKGRLGQGRPVASKPPLLSPAYPTASVSLFSPNPRGLSTASTSSTSSYTRTTGSGKTIAFADFIKAYADQGVRVMSVVDPMTGETIQSSTDVDLLSPHSSHTDFEDESDDGAVRLSIISAMPRTEDAAEGDAKVRFLALMTSKWLSFGRVLVSAAHEEMRSERTGNRILVVDGLRSGMFLYSSPVHV